MHTAAAKTNITDNEIKQARKKCNEILNEIREVSFDVTSLDTLTKASSDLEVILHNI